MAEQITIGIRGTSETKARLDRLAEETGLSQKELLERMVGLYEQFSRNHGADLNDIKEFQQLRYHLRRVEEIYISLVREAKDKAMADAETVEKAKKEAEEARKVAEAARQEVRAVREELEKVKGEAEKRIKELEEKLAAAQEAREQAVRVAALAERAAAEATEKVKYLEEEANKYYGLLTEKERLEKEIEKMKERWELEIEKAVLAAQQEGLKEVARLQEELARVREEKAELEIRLAKI
ncbi:hypothetical protein V3F56_03410 [Moorellaceae bacterium AZ2]